MSKRINLEGKQFGKWTVLYFHSRSSRTGHSLWLCRCACSCTGIIPAQNLLRGLSLSCGKRGCRKRTVKHGYYGTPEYKAYWSAKRRCSPNYEHAKDYAERGIRFLFSSFEQFLAEVGPRPSSKHSLDRRDNDGPYGPGNIRWATKKEQIENRRAFQSLSHFSTEELLDELRKRGTPLA